MLVGLILQLLTFGANFFILTVGGPSLFSESSRQSILILSLLWSAVTTTIAMVVVHRLRAWIYNTEADDLFNLYEDDEEDEEEKGVYNTLVREECHFVEGTTIGVCLAWVIVDANAESTYNVYFSAGTLILALACCRLWLRLCLIQTSTTKHRNQHEVSDMLLLV